jgi:spore maturation protein CgeB
VAIGRVGVVVKVLFVSLAWDYKDPARGPSFEFTNFWLALQAMEGVEATFFAFDDVEIAEGTAEMNRRLLDRVEDERPELVFFFLFEDEIHRDTVEAITRSTTTLNWFADDHWRFDSFTRRWATAFTWSSTTDRNSIEKYREVGQDRVILTQWACNHHLYRPSLLPQDIPMTFVGQAHGSRKRTIREVRRAGIDVETWGFGWPNGRLGIREMLEVFNRSQINLNMSNASHAISVANLTRLPVETLRAAVEGRGASTPLRRMRAAKRDQIKGRNFEIPGVGGFLLTNHLPDLHLYYVPNEEVVTFANTSELIDKARYFLDHETERRVIASAGLERTLRDHTYEQRFKNLFSEMAL